MKKALLYVVICIIIRLLTSCSTTKFVPENSYLLDAVKIQTDNKDIKPSSLQPYIRQNPNGKWFSLVKTQLHIYSLSGRDSTNWFNKFLRKIGDAPVIYDEALAQRSQEEITKAVHNLGYMGATVQSKIDTKKKKLKITYQVTSGRPYLVRSLNYDIQDPQINNYFQNDTTSSLLKEGMLFDVNVLDNERQRLTNILSQNGYYKFHKDFITYTADTVRNTYQIDLTLHLNPYRASVTDSLRNHSQYKIDKVNFITNFDAGKSSLLGNIVVDDSIHYAGYPIYYKDKLYLRPRVLINNLRIRPGSLYNEKEVQQTHNSFGRLSALKYTNIRFVEKQWKDSTWLDAYVLLTKNKSQFISFEVEGTNSSGDLGAAAAVSYQHNNFFHGSERLMIKARGAYEAISGLGNEYNYDNYTEYGVEASINFPRFLFPFLSSSFKRGIRASTELSLQYNYQLRPEFSRMLAATSWGYRWQRGRNYHRVDLLDINYLYMPWISSKFRESFLEDNKNYILEYNYKNRFIVRTGYMYNFNSIGANLSNNTIASNSFTIRAGFESAGNVLYAFSKALGLPQNSDGEYSILDIPFAQYLKGDFDFAKNTVIAPGNSIAFHFGIGVAVPYGNAKVLPFEKQYFSGGANSVRGWSVRGLGPGTFPGDDNFLNQSGNIKLDASIEYRTELFWKFQGAAFIDAGNIWTIREYEEQPGGKFYFDKFYKQLAVAYGLGLRLDLDFFVLRFDGGMKAVNPQEGAKKYPIFNPKFSRDFAFHFAVGYPF
ncbi:MAG: BamA/TamA family outer membrane protein [Bacteroides sp.]|nr:BamA/TamA family outer membrane protein [Bacteroides sp.]